MLFFWTFLMDEPWRTFFCIILLRPWWDILCTFTDNVKTLTKKCQQQKLENVTFTSDSPIFGHTHIIFFPFFLRFCGDSSITIVCSKSGILHLKISWFCSDSLREIFLNNVNQIVKLSKEKRKRERFIKMTVLWGWACNSSFRNLASRMISQQGISVENYAFMSKLTTFEDLTLLYMLAGNR